MMSDLFSQEQIRNARFMVIGCGALGNEVLKNLALFGAEHIVLVDFDEVEVGNLSRSVLFTRQDAEDHDRKVKVAARRLKDMNPRMEIVPIDGDIAYDVGLGWIRRSDVVIGCVDSRWARYCINRLCMRAGVPWVDGGISQLEGTVRVFAPGENCYACNLGPEGLNDLKRRIPCSGIIRQQEAAGHAPTTPVIASIVGAVQVQEALKLVHWKEMEDGKFTSLCGSMFYYEGQHLTTQLTSFKAYDDDCCVHDTWSPIIPVKLSTQNQVQEVLETLKELYNASELCFTLPDDCFVDFITEKKNDRIFHVMKPGREVAEWIENNVLLRGSRYTDLYQHEYRTIGTDFPYSDLTLNQLGVPSWSVFPVSADGKEFYVELENER